MFGVLEGITMLNRSADPSRYLLLYEATQHFGHVGTVVTLDCAAGGCARGPFLGGNHDVGHILAHSLTCHAINNMDSWRVPD